MQAIRDVQAGPYTLMPKLHILSGILEGKIIDIVEDRITIGRALDNMIRLEDGTVSHHHALLLTESGEFKLRDLNSTNGTRVNSLRIVETKLQNGDQVRVGSVEIRFESDAKKTSQPLPATQTSIDLSEVGTGSTPPPTFGPASPFARKKSNQRNPLVWIVLGLGILAIAALTLVAIKFASLTTK